MKKAMLIIDPQKDFIDAPEFMGALAVPGAYQDMKRLAKRINDETPDGIMVTMDTHAMMHIANPMWWMNEKGENPNPFTLITVEDVSSGKWRASVAEKQESSLEYVKALAQGGKYVLCVWPYHCIDGTEGHNVSEVLQSALGIWEAKTGKKVEYVFKGRNPNTEHYSGLKAEVVIPGDPETELNQTAINWLNQFDLIEVSGEAASHCVKSTALDLIASLGDEAKKVTILENCMSSVPGFEAEGAKFIKQAKASGCSVVAANEVQENKVKQKM